jgi:hypothetical protein
VEFCEYVNEPFSSGKDRKFLERPLACEKILCSMELVNIPKLGSYINNNRFPQNNLSIKECR